MAITEFSKDDQLLVQQAREGWPEYLDEWKDMDFVPKWVGTGKSAPVRMVVFIPAESEQGDPSGPNWKIIYSREHGYSTRPMPPHTLSPADLIKDLVIVP